MFWLTILLLFISVYYSKKEYTANRIGAAMFWAGLTGWNLHNLLIY